MILYPWHFKTLVEARRGEAAEEGRQGRERGLGRRRRAQRTHRSASAMLSTSRLEDAAALSCQVGGALDRHQRCGSTAPVAFGWRDVRWQKEAGGEGMEVQRE